MDSVLFLQSETRNPYAIYEEMLVTNPVYRDNVNNIWAVYGYENCRKVLFNSSAIIPPMNTEGLNDYALAIAGKLTRFSNPPDHNMARQVAFALFQNRKAVSVQEILKELIDGKVKDHKIDWVEVVGRHLPLLGILKGFEFAQPDCKQLSGWIGQLISIMQPGKTENQLKSINEISGKVYMVVEKHCCQSDLLITVINNLVAQTKCSKAEILALCVSSLIGLMMQSYDACRGLLTNVLLQYLTHKNLQQTIKNDKEQLKKFVMETLRYDPPVHNTRRIASENILLGKTKIKKGEAILVVLAAANRDAHRFTDPGLFDIERNNNNDHLTFGAGPHACVAAQFATQMAIDALSYLIKKYAEIDILSKNIDYEPLVNVRLPKSIIISRKVSDNCDYDSM